MTFIGGRMKSRHLQALCIKGEIMDMKIFSSLNLTVSC
jgi:hypothetical protein